MQDDEIIRVDGEVVDERDMPRDVLLKLVKNPEGLQGLFQLSQQQSRNVIALITGGGTAASVKYFGPVVGDTLAAVIGAFLTSHIAKKVVGK